jgi:dinuclear metal center YbgI/SA1388 family protein
MVPARDEGPQKGPQQEVCMTLEELVAYLDETLDIRSYEDYPGAFNGLQLERRAAPDDQAATPMGRIKKLAVAVDACRFTLEEAGGEGAELLLVHHGLLWGELRPFTGPRYRRLAAAMEGNLAVYGCHLPLDAHPELGNNAELVRALGFTPDEGARFGEHQGRPLGYCVDCDLPWQKWVKRIDEAVGEPCQPLPTGPERIRRFAVVTGGGASFIEEAARAGCQALLTGEASHRHYFEAEERGINLALAGHYATECFGVRAVARHLEETFGIPWVFIDHDTGL